MTDFTESNQSVGGQNRWSRLIALDLRSLALLRIGMGGLILYDLWVRAADLTLFHTDAGILPRTVLFGPLRHTMNEATWSLYFGVGESWQVATLFTLNAVLALLLMIGWRTRLMTVLCWFMLTSLQNRFMVILHGGDGILRMLLFWSIFLPLGACFSVDSALLRVRSGARSVASVASAALIAEVALIYVTAAALKSDEAWHNGQALFLSLHCDFYVRPFGIWVREHGGRLLSWGTYVAMTVEFVGPLLLVIPWRHALWRSLGVVVFVSFHLGLLAMMDLGAITYVCILAWLALLPTPAWDWLESRVARADRSPAELCGPAADVAGDRLARLVCTFGMVRDLRLAEATQEASWVLRSAGRGDLRGAALVAELLRRSAWAWPLADLADRPAATRAAGVLARFLPRRSSPAWERLLPLRDHGPRLPRVVSAILIVPLYWVLTWNLQMGFEGHWRQLHPHWFNRVAYTLRLDQYHNMFSPGPPVRDGWFVIIGETADGQRVNILADTSDTSGSSFEKPDLATLHWPSERWNKLMFQASTYEYAAYRPAICDALVARWQEAHPRAPQVIVADMYFIIEETTLDGPEPPLQSLLLRRTYGPTIPPPSVPQAVDLPPLPADDTPVLSP